MGKRGLPAEVAAVGVLFAVVSVAAFVTYSRLPAAELYHVSGSGLTGGASRVLVFLNFPVAIAGIAVIAVLADRLQGRFLGAAAVAGVALCAVLFWPGVVDQSDLDARAVNALPALGVAVAAGLGVIAALRGGLERPVWRGGSDVARLVVAAVLLILAVPWLAAELGLSFNGVPVLGTLYQTGELRSQPDLAGLHPAVHHGQHHGLYGVELVLTGLLLSRVLPALRRRRLHAVTGGILALMVSYGIANFANDFWLEQVVKRGWTDWEIPDVTEPSISVAWGIILLGAAGIVVVATRLGARGDAGERRPRTVPGSPPPA